MLLPFAARSSLILLALSVSCTASRSAAPPVSAPAPASAPVAVAAGSIAVRADPCDPSNETVWVDCTIARLSPRDRAAQMVWPWVLGDYVSSRTPAWEKIDSLITKVKVGGFIMSVGSPLEIVAKINAMQRLAEVPLILSADLEYGAGYRARGGVFLPNGIDLGGATLFPPQMAVGATGDPTLAYEMGRITAIEGRALGIQIVFGPILDVNSNPANPVINTRSFGADPQLDARFGAAFIRGVQETGLIATGKHFPGHGDTEVNSHLSLPTVSASRARLDTLELVPFRAAVQAGVGAIMTFHGSLPALDSTGVPATISRPILTGLLRGDMGFGGLIISDAFDMRGVLARFGVSEVTKRAIDAGVDVVLQPSATTQIIDAMLAGVTEGRYTQARLDSSVRRILIAKYRQGLHLRRPLDLDTARAVVADSEHLATAQLVAERSITLVKDSLRMVPLGRLTRNARILSITFARRSDLLAGSAFNAELRVNFPALRSEPVNADDPGTNFWRLLQAADSADVVLVGSYPGHSSDAANLSAPRPFVDFLGELTTRGKRPIIIAFGDPYLLQQVPQVPAYVIAWTGFPMAQRAAAHALLGTTPITGRLPIAIPPYAVLGAGEQRAAAALATPR
jgi:beta-N-acetylhexosaminidase